MDEMRWNNERGHKSPAELKVGAMLETPAFAYSLEAVANEADFISVGTNDLMQFFFAADRMTPRVSDRYDILSRPALDFLKMIAETCARLDLPVSVCGECTGRPLEALALIALGYRKLSMPAGGIGPVKRMIRSLKLKPLEEAFLDQLSKSNGAFRNDLLALSREHGVLLTDG